MSAVTESKIEVRHVFKVFGNREKDVLALIRAGKSKDQVLAETGCVVGINDLSLSIQAGEVFVIMGLSGSGKSTLVRHLNRLVDPTSGQILVDGEDILQYDMSALRHLRRHKISMVFQNFGLLPHRTVLENVAYGLKVRGENKAQCNERARHWIGVVGLQGYEQAMIHQLSGGMRQRVGLARALATDTDIILMDEAFSALDPLIRAEMQDQLLELQHFHPGKRAGQIQQLPPKVQRPFHLHHTGHGEQAFFDHPVLQRAQIGQAVGGRALDLVAQDFTHQAGGLDLGLHAIGQVHIGLQIVGHLVQGEVVVGAVLEGDAHERQAIERGGTDVVHARRGG